MTNRTLNVVVLWTVAAIVVPAGHAAKITRKNGQSVEGKASGLVVLRGDNEKGATFIILNGEDITALDGAGVHFRPGSVVGVLISTEPKTDPAEALEIWTTYPPPPGGGLWLKGTRDGGIITMAKRGKEENPLRNKVLGTFEMAEEKGRLIPKLGVETSQGVLTLAVQDLPDY